MSLLVEPALPYSASELKLDDAKRWSQLLPLIRPSVKVVEMSETRRIVLDMAFSRSSNVLVACIGRVGHFSGKILSEATVAAFATEQFGEQLTTADDIAKILESNAFPIQNGVVAVRADLKQDLVTTANGVVEIAVVGELKFDHVLSLLSSSNSQTKSSLDKTKSLLKLFIKSAEETTTTFRDTKMGCGPSVIHGLKIAEFSSAKTAIVRDLSHLLSSRPASEADTVYSIHFADINGFSRLENDILAHEISEFFAKKTLSSYITQSTILNSHFQARGWAISICPIPTAFISAQLRPLNTLSCSTGRATSVKLTNNTTSKIQISDALVRKIITAGCENVIKEEPAITEYDTIVGDGDCGYTLRDGAKQVLSFISIRDLSSLASTLNELVDDLEVNMGGTSGALYCIFLSSLAQNLWDAPTLPGALQGALDHLLQYTKARLGDRTCLDCLIPFVQTLTQTGDSNKALAEAQKGVETTKTLEAKLGRSSYLDEAATRGVPDPGAYGLLKLLEGMVRAN